MSNRRLDPTAGIRAVAWPPAQNSFGGARSLRPISKWFAQRRARDELAQLAPRLRRDIGLPFDVTAPDQSEGVGALRFRR